MTSMDRDDEGVLVARLRAGDAAAFDEVYDAYRPRVFAFLLRMSRNRTLAEDLLDETWLRLVRHATRLLPETRIGPWLFTVARHLYWSARRDSRVEEASAFEQLTLWPSPAPWPSPFDLAAASELERRVERALSTLSPQYREVVLLVGHEGLTPSDAAAVCGISADALRQRLSRARAMLAEKLRQTPRGVLRTWWKSCAARPRSISAPRRRRRLYQYCDEFLM
jgi:RNA polymerase sigma-70 factor (ECF subfamily)